MRWRKADLRGRVNGNLALRFAERGLTSYGGLEFVRCYVGLLGLVPLLRRELGTGLPRSDFGVPTMVLVLLTLVISGGRRLRHLLYLAGDPLVLRLCGLTRLPTPRTVGRWLTALRARHLPRLQRVNALVVARAIRHAGLRRLTIDVVGSVVSTGQQVQWAHRGYNPHHRKVPSYYPITAYEAQSGQVLRVQNRPGNVDDAKAARRFLRDLFAQLRATLGGLPARISHGWRVFSALHHRAAGAGGGRVRDQGALLRMGRSQGACAADPGVEAGRGDGELCRACRRAGGVGQPPLPGRPLPASRPARDGEELPARSLRSE